MPVCGERNVQNSISVPYSWLQREFDPLSSVTLKMSFFSRGCYRHTDPDSFKPLSQEKKEPGKKKSTAKVYDECIWKETK